MLVRISGGRDGKIQSPLVVFTNKDRHYPMKVASDNIRRVPYHSGSKGWIDRTVLPQRLRERNVIWELLNNRKCILHVDNCIGHSQTLEKQYAPK